MRLSFRWRIGLLGAGILVLLLLYLFGEVSGPQQRTLRASQRALIGGLAPQVVAKVVFSSPDRLTVTLERQGAAWFVANGTRLLPASGTRVGAMLDGLAGLSSGRIMTSDPNKKVDFELTTPHVRSVRLYGSDGKSIAEISVGKAGPGAREDYLAVDGGNEVHLSPSPLGFYLSQGPTYWYDLALLPYEVTGPTIAEISVSGAVSNLSAQGTAQLSPENYRLVRSSDSGNEWRAVGVPAKIDQLRVDSFANSLAVLQGVDFLAGPVPPTIPGSTVQVDVTTADGARFHLRGQATIDGQTYLFARSGGEELYVVNSEAVRRAIVPLRELTLSP
ncbi:MAG TPA: DUF4340 domain-containing protein [Spirochaetia bacterium]|nr:DUF4340 domain-containing protein [Spirochaetia bacterium]